MSGAVIVRRRAAPAAALALVAAWVGSQSSGTPGPEALPGRALELEVAVQLGDPPLALYTGAHPSGSRADAEVRRAHLARLERSQDDLMRAIAALGGRELGRVSRAHNALLVAIDPARVARVRELPGVAGVRPLPTYRMALGSTVPYVGGTAAHALGITGSGILVAVLDSGVDYTHRNLGGPGTTAAYTAAYGTGPASSQNKTRDGLFPTAKVSEGFDFVGEAWPSGPLAPDPDPIDFHGHGTHVADILAGRSIDGLHKGIAPDAELLALKVCSSVSLLCSGAAILQAIDLALDPNQDGSMDDGVQVINLSAYRSYGQREDDVSLAAANAVRAGVVVVSAAGDDGDKPYIVQAPSAAPEVISVSETQVPSALGYPLVIQAPASIAGTYPNTATVDWAPIGAGFSASAVAFVGRGCPAGSVSGQPGADPYLANPAGKVALIDHGACGASLKVDRAANAGAVGVLIGQVTAGDAQTLPFEGGSAFVPTLVISQATSNLIQANLAATVLVTVSPVISIPLVQSMVRTSARGPSYGYNGVKPDIGAPGASLSAVAGAGTGEAPFGGTSGAAPLVAGAAALLLEADPLSTAIEIKALLLDTAERGILSDPANQPGSLTPLTRLGAGELRVQAALASHTAAWDAGDPFGISLAFGHYRVTGMRTYKKKVLVRNFDSSPHTYAIAPDFRYAADAASGAVTLLAPVNVTVPAHGSATFVLKTMVDSSLLPAWSLNGGSRGGDGFRLQGVEFDGHVTLTGGGDTIRLPWHILLHKAANVLPAATVVNLAGSLAGSLLLTNMGGAIDGPVQVFSLTGTSPKLPPPNPAPRGSGFAVVDLKAVGVQTFDAGPSGSGLQFAVVTHGERSHPNHPAAFEVLVDVNRDGADDFLVFNGPSGNTGQNVTTVRDLTTSTEVTRFFTDADLGSSTAILSLLMSDLGMTPATQFDFRVLARDNYFAGLVTDTIGPKTYRGDTPRFTGSGIPAAGVPVDGASTLSITRNPTGDAASPSQKGLLLLYRDAQSGREASLINVKP